MPGRKCFIKDKFISVTQCEDRQALQGSANCAGCEYADKQVCTDCKRDDVVISPKGICGACAAKKDLGEESVPAVQEPACKDCGHSDIIIGVDGFCDPCRKKLAVEKQIKKPSKPRRTCVSCSRPDMVITGRGMCGNCYGKWRRAGSKEGEAPLLKAPKAPAVPEPVKAAPAPAKAPLPIAPVAPLPELPIINLTAPVPEAPKPAKAPRERRPIEPGDAGLACFCVSWVYVLYWLSGYDISERGIIPAAVYVGASLISGAAVWLRRRR